MVAEAAGKFGPASGRLDIDTSDGLHRCGLNVNEVSQAGKLPELDGFWKHLEKIYDDDAGREVAFARAAKAIINGFRLKPDSEIKRTGNAVVLE